jgi:MscS family membrane protein
MSVAWPDGSANRHSEEATVLQALLVQTYYGNTVLQWLTAAGIALGALIAGRALYWVMGNVVKKLTTKNRLDDLIVDMVEEPIVFVLVLGGAWFGVHTLTLPPQLSQWLGNALHFLLILTAAWLVTRLLDALHNEYLAPLAQKSATDLDDQLLPILRKGTKIVIWTIGLVVALNNAGYDVGALIAGLGIGGLALAMAAKDTVSNVFGGFTIFTDRPFKLNDRVKVAGFDGHIREIGVRSTRLQTLDGTLVTIPNATFADSAVENISLEPSRKVTTNLGLTYDTTPEKMKAAMELLREIASTTAGLEKTCNVAFNVFGDSALNIVFVYFISKDADILNTTSAVNMAILERFNAAGLEFAFPTRTIYSKPA